MAVSKLSAQDRYVTAIAAVSRSNRHGSLGSWSAAATSVELATFWATSHDANHLSVESYDRHWAGPKGFHEWGEPLLPLPSQLKLVLIYRPRRDGRLSWPSYHHCEQTVCRKLLRDSYYSCQLLKSSRLGSCSTGESRTHDLSGRKPRR